MATPTHISAPFLRTALAAAAMLGAASTAQAVVAIPLDSVYFFSGTCSDCTPAEMSVRAVLTLQNYLPGTDITVANLVSFTYEGSNLVDPFTVVAPGSLAAGSPGVYEFVTESPDHISGSMPLNPGAPAAFRLVFADGQGFMSSVAGAWAACGNGPGGYYSGDCSFVFNNDFGTGTWGNTAAVPEPSSWLLLTLGTAALARRLRQRRG